MNLQPAQSKDAYAAICGAGRALGYVCSEKCEVEDRTQCI